MSGRKAIRKGKAIAKVDPYKAAIAGVLVALEEIPSVRGTTSREYLAALERAEGEIECWIGASKDAARDDIRRAERAE